MNILAGRFQIRLSHSGQVIEMQRLLRVGNEVSMRNHACLWITGGSAAEVENSSPIKRISQPPWIVSK